MESPTRLAGRSWLERRELVAAAFTLLLSRLALATMTSRRAFAIAGLLTRRAKPSRRLAPERIAYLVHGLNRRTLRFTCLPLATATWARLRRHGYDAALRVGAPRELSSSLPLEAHAWVEIDGNPIGEAADLFERYAVLGDLGGGAR